MTVLWAVIGAALAIVWVLTVVDLVRRHLGAKRTAAWLLIVLILPFAGALLYWVLRKPEAGEAAHEAHVAHDLQYGAPRPPAERTRIGG